MKWPAHQIIQKASLYKQYLTEELFSTWPNWKKTNRKKLMAAAQRTAALLCISRILIIQRGVPLQSCIIVSNPFFIHQLYEQLIVSTKASLIEGQQESHSLTLQFRPAPPLLCAPADCIRSIRHNCQCRYMLYVHTMLSYVVLPCESTTTTTREGKEKQK